MPIFVFRPNQSRRTSEPLKHALGNRKVMSRKLKIKPGTSTPMDKARDELGWEPRLTLVEGMARIKEQVSTSANAQSFQEEI